MLDRGDAPARGPARCPHDEGTKLNLTGKSVCRRCGRRVVKTADGRLKLR